MFRHNARIMNDGSSKGINVMLRVTLVLIIIAILSACSKGDVSDLQQYVNETKTKHKGNIEPLPVVESYERYQYHSADKRDPFKPSVSLVKSISLSASNGITPDAKRTREDLEQFPLESLHMVGIMHNGGLTWGLIKAPDNTIYRVRKGNYMGKNHGKILNIAENKIQLKEIVSDGIGGWIEKPNSITISE